MIKYQKIPYKNAQGDTGFRYTKNGLMTKESRIPHEVMEKFEYTPTFEYDESPEKRRCIFCDAPQSRQRYLNSELIDLCEWHYQNARLGQIAAQVREVEKEKVLEAAKPVAKKKKPKTRKTALSSML